MNILFKIALVGLIPFSINAMDLKTMLKLTLHNNLNIKSQNYNISSKAQDYISISNTLKPSLDIGTNYSKLNLDVADAQVGATAVGFVKFSLDLYDGGKSNSIKKEKQLRVKLAKLSKTDTKKETLLQVITLYFNLLTIEDEIKSFKYKSKALLRDYKNKKQKYNLQMITYDEVLKLKSEYEANQYHIEELKYQKTQVYKNLSLLVGKQIKHISHTKLASIKHLQYKPSSTIKALQTNIEILNESLRQIKSNQKPKIKLEDTLSRYNYSDYNTNRLKDLPNNQNKIILSLSLNLYNTTTKAKKRSIIFAKKRALEQLKYNSEKEKMLYNLAYKRLLTQKSKIASAKSALDMSKIVYKSARAKYQNGMINIITYLDALSKRTINQALYYKALNDYEISKANYYFISRSDYKSIIFHIR